MPPIIAESDRDFMVRLNDMAPISPPIHLVSEYIESKRVIPPGFPSPGPWKNAKTPYLVEIMDNMSPYSPIQHTIGMKGAQIGYTSAAENVIAFFMDENPTAIMYMSATGESLSKWSENRLEPLIDSCGIRGKITATGDNPGSRRTGDKATSKTFIGGSLTMASARSPSAQRSDSIRVLIRDEIDGAPKMLTTGEGNWLDVSFARTNAWGERRKVFDFTTPTTFEDSNIWPEYQKGDRRRFSVPCPHCSHKQFLEWENVEPEFRDGILINVHYRCGNKDCNGKIYEHHKSHMLDGGQWIPTAKTTDPTLRSYQISTLYSPFMSFLDMYKRYLEQKDEQDGMRSFTNLYLGLPFKDKGYRPKLSAVLELTGDYTEGDIPDGVLWLTAGIDVQRGSRHGSKNPARLEMEVIGHGAGYRTWSILYRRFEGPIDNPGAGAWEDLNKFAIDGGLTFKRRDGKEFPVNLIFIDSGDGETTATVYQFCQGWANTYPSKGYNALKTRKKEKKDGGDEAGPRDFRRYRAAKIGEGSQFLYEVSTNYYKSHIYGNLNNTIKHQDEDYPGKMHFPLGRDQEYFAMLTSEEKRTDGSFHKIRDRNEALDCFCYAMCASDVFLDSKVRDFQLAAKSAGATPVQVQQVNHKWVLDRMEKETAIKLLQPSRP